MDLMVLSSLIATSSPDIIDTVVTGVENGISVKSFIVIIGLAGGTLGTAISILFKTTQDLNKKYAELSQNFGRLEGKQDGIRELSYRVLDVVHNNVHGKISDTDIHNINKQRYKNLDND
jgi:hypothetical protein